MYSLYQMNKNKNHNLMLFYYIEFNKFIIRINNYQTV